MNDIKSIFSKSIKKDLVKRHDEERIHALELRDDTPPMLKAYLNADRGEQNNTVLKFNEKLFFSVNFREALKDKYTSVLSLYQMAIELHNAHMVGGRYPDDGFEWFYQNDICEHQNKIVKEFAAIGKELAFKKRRKSAFDAQYFLYKNVLSPLDNFTWAKGSHLEFFFEHAIDVLAQSFLSEFIKTSVHISSPFDYYSNVTINYSDFCKTPSEAKFLENQIQIYNVRDYVVVETCIKNIVSKLNSRFVITSALKLPIEREQMLFDMYELIPLYIKSWDIDKHKIVIDDEWVIFLFIEFGRPSFAIGKLSDHIDKVSVTTFKFIWSLTGEQWCLAKLDCALEEMRVLCDYVLNEFHNKLLSLYLVRKKSFNKIDLYSNYDKSDELVGFTYEYHQSLEDVEQTHTCFENDAITKKSFGRVPSVTMSYFLSFMKKAFDCNVENGKGSEIKIWRFGSKIFTLGRHKQDQQISSFVIGKILKRLSISKEEWLLAFNKRV
ncbi:hypothetical protein [Aeromonas salmonicida]|uniref:hypothetical protein n=1 Tax=Aeromonas salmonicida TaxID=645 RepID=UPI0012D920BC|nr:hypothetical protein [Aeromonas salmonicida]MUG29770.1 hypothetical protein [Aeromonas salmonicida]